MDSSWKFFKLFNIPLHFKKPKFFWPSIFAPKFLILKFWYKISGPKFLSVSLKSFVGFSGFLTKPEIVERPPFVDETIFIVSHSTVLEKRESESVCVCVGACKCVPG